MMFQTECAIFIVAQQGITKVGHNSNMQLNQHRQSQKNLLVINLLEISVSNENQPWIGGEILETHIQQYKTPQYIVSW